jgi:hypothetical protein
VPILIGTGRVALNSSGGLTAPFAVWTSDPDVTTPVFTLTFTAAPGYQLQSQVSLSSGFASPEYDDTHTLTSDEILAGAFAPIVGPLVPSPWFARFRVGNGVSWSQWSNTVTETINTYVGLFDVRTTTPLGYWGLQAASSAFTVGANIVTLRRASDNATQTFSLQYDGRLDLDAIATFRDAAGASTVHITTLFGQGIAIDLAQATAAKQPEFVLDEISGWGAMKFVRASSQMLAATGSGIVSAQPFTMYVVVKRTGTFTSHAGVFGLQSSASASTEICRVAFENVVDSLGVYTGSGSGLFGDCPDDDWNTWCITVNDASSAGDVNAGADSPTGATSADTLVSGAVRIGGLSDGNEHLDGYLSEVAVWSGDPGGPQRRLISANSLDRLLIGF